MVLNLVSENIYGGALVETIMLHSFLAVAVEMHDQPISKVSHLLLALANEKYDYTKMFLMFYFAMKSAVGLCFLVHDPHDGKKAYQDLFLHNSAENVVQHALLDFCTIIFTSTVKPRLCFAPKTPRTVDGLEVLISFPLQ